MLPYGMDKKSIIEIRSLPETEQLIRCRERLEEFHMENRDYVAAIKDKWALAMLAQGGSR